MNHIIIDVNPFDLSQSIYVYVDGACVNQTSVVMDQISDTVAGLRNQYSINQIDLYGNKDFVSRFKTEMNTKFNNTECEINIIEK